MCKRNLQHILNILSFFNTLIFTNLICFNIFSSCDLWKQIDEQTYIAVYNAKPLPLHSGILNSLFSRYFSNALNGNLSIILSISVVSLCTIVDFLRPCVHPSARTSVPPVCTYLVLSYGVKCLSVLSLLS